NKRWHQRLDQVVAWLADRVVAISKHTETILVDRDHVPRRKVSVIHNGVDLTRYRPVEAAQRDNRRRRFDLPADVLVLLVPARLDELKGHRYLFEAMPPIRAGAPKPPLLLLAGA